MTYKVKFVDNKTIIDKIVVGVPIRSIKQSTGDINDLNGIDISLREHGSVLVYDEDASIWKAQNLLERQTIDGGYY